MERLPDYYFIQPQVNNEEDDGPSDPGKTNDDDDDYCWDYCDSVCHDDYICYALCHYDCEAGIFGKDYY